jgi:MGT family glycosyltransferase
MKLLIISPDYASHYSPLAVLGRAVLHSGGQVVVATGQAMRQRVEADGFAWQLLVLGPDANEGLANQSPEIQRFISATRISPLATIERQALDREHDLLWQPERVAREIMELCAQVNPDHVLVDHVSFGSTLAMHASGRPFVTLVPGHPSQLPVGPERYGIPSIWPQRLLPEAADLVELEAVVDRVTRLFTNRWNDALAAVAPERPPVEDAFRVHGHRVLYNSPSELQDPARTQSLPANHCFVGPLLREESLTEDLIQWGHRDPDRPNVYVALGTFLSLRSDVLALVAEATKKLGARAAIAIGATPTSSLGAVPEDWIVASQLPQVALLQHADLVIHHGGNNSVQESLAMGVRQVVLPFSTDQFANAADLERTGSASVWAPNEITCDHLAEAMALELDKPEPNPIPARDLGELATLIG